MGRMRGSFSDIISASIEWTKTVLFRPFEIKKWLMMFFIALLAFQLSGGCNNNSSSKSGGPSSSSKKNLSTAAAQQGGAGQIAGEKSAKGGLKANPLVQKIKNVYSGSVGKRGRFATNLIIFLVLGLIVLIILLIWWLFSVFTFIFIEAVISNDASVRRPFISNMGIGRSYFLWNLIYSLVVWVMLGLIIKSGYDALVLSGAFDPAVHMSLGAKIGTVIIHVIALVLIFIISGIVTFFIANLVIPVMYKSRMPILKAIPEASSVLRSDIGSFVKYVFVKWGLWIVVSILGGLITLAVTVGILFPTALAAGILALIYKVTPMGIRPAYIVLMWFIGVPLVVGYVFFVKIFFLPFAVFMKTFNLKFLGRVDSRYDLFKFSEMEVINEMPRT